MTAPDMGVIREHHGQQQARHETHLRTAIGNRYATTSLTQGARHAWWAAIEWVLTQQLAVDAMDPGELVLELRKREGSIFWPLFAGDPTFWARCPRCDMRTLTTADGCADCGHDYQ